jgi:WD40 repeat protein
MNLNRTKKAEIILGGRITTSNEFIFTPNGERLVSIDAEGQLSLWNARSGHRIRVLASNDDIDPYEIDVSADGRWIIAPTDLEAVTVWNARTGAEIVRITGLLGSRISWVLSDDGRYLAIEDDYLRELWDLRARRKIADLGMFGRRIYRATFSHDSAYLLFNRSSDNQTDPILLWSVAEGRVLADLGEFSRVTTYIIAGHEIGAVSWEHASDYALWTLAPAQRLLSCSDAYMTLVQQEGREDVRLLGLSRETDEAIVWRLTPPRRS